MGRLIINYDNTNTKRPIKSESFQCYSEESASRSLEKRKNILTAIFKWGKKSGEYKQLI